MLITLEMAKEWAQKEIEAEGEDFIYREDDRRNNLDPVCMYWSYEMQAPDCLVGRILINNGAATALDFRGHVNTEKITNLIEDETFEGVEFTGQAKTFLSVLQLGQDCGDAWGAAFEDACQIANEQ